MAFLSVDKQWELISRGAEEILPEKELREKLMAKEFTENERKVLATGKSNAGYHYNGSALTMAGIGKGFAEAMLEFK